MGKKLTLEYIKEFCHSLGCDLLDKEYNGDKTKINFKDKEGYLYCATFSGLKNKKALPMRFHPSNKYTINNIKLWTKDSPYILISDKYIKSDLKLKWKCLKPECGEIFEASWDSIFQNSGCPFCVGQKVGLSNCLATKRPDLAKEWHPTKNGELTPFNVTPGSNKKVWWQCTENPKHEWYRKINKRTENDDIGCIYCWGRYPTEEYNLLVCNPELASEWDYTKNDKNPEDYIPNANIKVSWICGKCGYNWDALINNRNRNNSGCPECLESKGEKECKRIFTNKGFIHISQENYEKLSDLEKTISSYLIPQKYFNNLLGIGNRLLSYDFYIPKYNLLIEYQGAYHDGTAGNQSKKDFERQVEHDNRKKNYAISNGYNFLEIWYWDYHNIEQILSQYISLIDNKKLCRNITK